MVVTTVRKSLVAVLMALTIMGGLITGFAHAQAITLTPTSSIRTLHGQIAGDCPPPPIVCLPQRFH